MLLDNGIRVNRSPEDTSALDENNFLHLERGLPKLPQRVFIVRVVSGA